jgi:hypothetical protein
MSQVLKSLDAVTSDADGDVLAFNSPQTKYAMHYIATVPSGSATVWLEGSLDGVNFFTVQNASLGSNTNAVFEGGPPALFIRARAAGLAAGRTVTAFVAVAD